MEYITDQPKHRNYTNRLDQFWSIHPQELRAGNEPKQTTWEAIKDTYDDYARTFRRYFAALLFLFNLHVVILSVCSCIAVYLCSKKYWNINFKVDTSFLALGTAFPLSFGINVGFQRRERALLALASLKSSCISLYWMHRDWDATATYPGSLNNTDKPNAVACETCLFEFLCCVRNYLKHESGFESYAEFVLDQRGDSVWRSFFGDSNLSVSKFTSSKKLQRVATKASKDTRVTDLSEYWLLEAYKRLSRLSVLNECLTKHCGYGKAGEGGMSRVAQYLRYLSLDLENLRCLYQYRTPMMLRYGCCVLIHVFAIALAPYFGSFCETWSRTVGEKNLYTNKAAVDTDTCPAGYIAACVFVVVTMLMYSIQTGLEMPFDMKGLDDVFFDIERELLYVSQGKSSITASFKDTAANGDNKVKPLDDTLAVSDA